MSAEDQTQIGKAQGHGSYGTYKTYILALACLLAMPSSSAEVRYHGFKMSPQYRLVIEEENGLVKIGLLSRRRNVGGAPSFRAGETPTTETPPADSEALNPLRSAKKENLIQVRSEALEAAAPSPLKNAAKRYRVTLEGVDLLPGYAVTFDVDAPQARARFYSEIQKFLDRSDGIYREALHNAAPLTLGILSEAGRMPAELPEAVRASEVARLRGLYGAAKAPQPGRPAPPSGIHEVQGDTP